MAPSFRTDGNIGYKDISPCDNLSLLVLLCVVVGGWGWVEHVGVVRWRGRPRVLGRMTEGEHVEGGGGCTVQHVEAADHLCLSRVVGPVHHTY